jgi:cobalamin biosynthesis Co2+ chelatase CbiK
VVPEEVEDFEEDFGSRMIGKRLADDTKNQYEQKVKNLKAWLLLNHPTQINDGQTA